MKTNKQFPSYKFTFFQSRPVYFAGGEGPKDIPKPADVNEAKPEPMALKTERDKLAADIQLTINDFEAKGDQAKADRLKSSLAKLQQGEEKLARENSVETRAQLRSDLASDATQILERLARIRKPSTAPDKSKAESAKLMIPKKSISKSPIKEDKAKELADKGSAIMEGMKASLNAGPSAKDVLSTSEQSENLYEFEDTPPNTITKDTQAQIDPNFEDSSQEIKPVQKVAAAEIIRDFEDATPKIKSVPKSVPTAKSETPKPQASTMPKRNPEKAPKTGIDLSGLDTNIQGPIVKQTVSTLSVAPELPKDTVQKYLVDLAKKDASFLMSPDGTTKIVPDKQGDKWVVQATGRLGEGSVRKYIILGRANNANG